MERLQEIIKLSRFVTIAQKNKMYTIEANFWPSDETQYTINVRASGMTIDNAVENLYKKVESIRTE